MLVYVLIPWEDDYFTFHYHLPPPSPKNKGYLQTFSCFVKQLLMHHIADVEQALINIERACCKVKRGLSFFLPSHALFSSHVRRREIMQV